MDSELDGKMAPKYPVPVLPGAPDAPGTTGPRTGAALPASEITRIDRSVRAKEEAVPELLNAAPLLKSLDEVIARTRESWEQQQDADARVRDAWSQMGTQSEGGRTVQPEASSPRRRRGGFRVR